MHQKIMPDIISDKQSICCITVSSTAKETAERMADSNVAAIVVLDEDEKLIGIITERDISRRIVAKGLDAQTTLVGDFMTKNPDTLAPGDTALDALELMRSRQFRHLPVVEGDTVVGMVSIRDLYDSVKGELEKNIRETEAFVFGDRYGA